MTTASIMVKRLPHGKTVALPSYQTLGSAGLDIQSAENLMVGKHETVLVKTGLAFEIPPGFEIQVRSRSGMASKGIFVTNSPGTIDSDYRGEVGIILTNFTDAPYHIGVGQRIAQLVVAPVTRGHFIEVDELTPTLRGDGGYGSTGV